MGQSLALDRVGHCLEDPGDKREKYNESGDGSVLKILSGWSGQVALRLFKNE